MRDTVCTGCLSTLRKLKPCGVADCGAAYCSGCLRKYSSCVGTHSGVMVCPMCECQNNPVGDDYTEDVHGCTEDKQKANSRIVAAFGAILAHAAAPHRVLVLDTGHTAGMLLRLIKPPPLVVVPNPSLGVWMKLQSLVNAGCVAWQTRVGSYLTQNRGDCDFLCVWLDFCSTYHGNNSDHVKPWHDLRKVWEYGLRRPDGTRRLVAATFSTRNCTLTPDKIVAEQIKCAAAYGWTAEEVCREKYKHMVFIAFCAM